MDRAAGEAVRPGIVGLRAGVCCGDYGSDSGDQEKPVFRNGTSVLKGRTRNRIVNAAAEK